jgi:RimJ/RimL family protein N-acetyltransferase
MSDFFPEQSIDSAGYRLRLAEKTDARLLWEWANDPSTRKQSFHESPIPWVDHENWFYRLLSWPLARVWILERQSIPVGQIRYERRCAEVAYISFSVAKPSRGRGIGTRLLLSTEPFAARELKIRCARGITFIENVASQRAFLNARFGMRKRTVIQGHACLIFERVFQRELLEPEPLP